MIRQAEPNNQGSQDKNSIEELKNIKKDFSDIFKILIKSGYQYICIYFAKFTVNGQFSNSLLPLMRGRAGTHTTHFTHWICCARKT